MLATTSSNAYWVVATKATTKNKIDPILTGSSSCLLHLYPRPSAILLFFLQFVNKHPFRCRRRFAS
eukprot:m.190209 g.190209  ORF g.190209 m.190209 type:complete len:66 (+) comp16753_c1_seq3:1056-1253(+)